MNKESPPDMLFEKDIEQIRDKVEELLIEDLLEQNLLLPHVQGSNEVPKSDFVLWHMDIRKDEEFITNLYICALGRPPTEKELQIRCHELAQPSASRRYLSDNVFSSREARKKAESMSANYELLRLYELILRFHRETFRQISKASILSDDGRTLDIQNITAIHDPALLVAATYRDLLGRIPDFCEFQPWANALANGRLSRAEFLHRICTSPEALSRRQNKLDLSPLEDLTDFQRDHIAGALSFGGLMSEIFYLRNSGETANSWITSGDKNASGSTDDQSGLAIPPHQASDEKTDLGSTASPKRDISDLREKVLIEIDRRYRGTRESLHKQMEFYRPYLMEVKELGPMLDIGCGRGLLMRLMRDIEAKAVGIDLSTKQVEYCQANGLDARQVEATEFLDKQHDETYSAVTMLHIVEHLSFDDLLRILSEVYRVLAPGGIVLIETPNPENLFISSITFHIDPTHKHPVTFEYISTVLSIIGFQVERLPLHMPMHEDIGNHSRNFHLNNFLMASGNLSVLGRKPA